LYHICAIVIEVPQFSIVFLMSPPKRVLLEELILFKVLTNPPTLIVSKSQPILLEEGVDSWDTMVPGFFQIIESKATVLCLRLLTLYCILCPYTLTVDELRFPCLDIAVQVGDELVLFV